VKSGHRKCDVLDCPFLGSEWEKPITSFENGTLVRLLYRLALFIDLHVAPQINEWITKTRGNQKTLLTTEHTQYLRVLGSYVTLLFVGLFTLFCFVLVWLL
jgi:hypothetical protein